MSLYIVSKSPINTMSTFLPALRRIPQILHYPNISIFISLFVCLFICLVFGYIDVKVTLVQDVEYVISSG